MGFDLISHTKGHISYYVTGKEGEDPAGFTGDTLVSSVFSRFPFLWGLLESVLISSDDLMKSFFLEKTQIYMQFVGGCGKFFEGTAQHMYQSLCLNLASLPRSTRVFCGHEVEFEFFHPKNNNQFMGFCLF